MSDMRESLSEVHSLPAVSGGGGRGAAKKTGAETKNVLIQSEEVKP